MKQFLPFSDSKKTYNCIAFAFAIMWMIFVYHILGFYYETNDDRYIAEILCGALTGSPESHVAYLNYLLGIPLAFLYKITTAVPWYGLMLLLFHTISYGSLLKTLYRHCKTHFDFLFASILTLAVGFCGIYISSLLQFTSTAIFLAATGYVCLFLAPPSKKKYFSFFLFEFLAYLLRENSMLMVQPIGISVYVGLLASEEYFQADKFTFKSKVAWQNLIKRFLPICSIAIGVVLLGTLGHNIVYHKAEWKEYKDFNKYRSQMFDYYGTPEYSSVTHILDKYNVTQAEYEAFRHYTILDGNINAACLKELAEFAGASYHDTTDWSHILSKVIDSYIGTGHWNLGRVTLALWFAFIVCIIIHRKIHFLFPALTLIFAHFFVWSFLFYQGRIVNRVCLPLYLCEIIFLFVLFWLCYQNSSSKTGHFKKYFMLLCCIFFCYGSYQTAVMQYRYVAEQIEMQSIYYPGLYDIQNYCYSQPEKTFIVEANSLSYYRGSVLDTDIYKTRNNILSGGWYSNSPAYDQYLTQYLKNGFHDFYLIVTDSNEPQFLHAINYLSERSGASPIIADKFSVSHGGSYLVYYFE